MRPAIWWLWAVASVTGVVLIALPDGDARLFSFSGAHGPSPVDLAGMMMLVGGWSVLDVGLWRGRRVLLQRRRVVAAAALLSVMAATVVVWSVSLDRGSWWLLGAGVLAAVQVAGGVLLTADAARR